MRVRVRQGASSVVATPGVSVVSASPYAALQSILCSIAGFGRGLNLLFPSVPRFNEKIASLEAEIAAITAGKEKVKERYDAGVVRMIGCGRGQS